MSSLQKLMRTGNKHDGAWVNALATTRLNEMNAHLGRNQVCAERKKKREKNESRERIENEPNQLKLKPNLQGMLEISLSMHTLGARARKTLQSRIPVSKHQIWLMPGNKTKLWKTSNLVCTRIGLFHNFWKLKISCDLNLSRLVHC